MTQEEMGVSSSKIFRDRRVLDLDYMPDPLVHRDIQIAEMTRALKPLLNGARPRSLLGLGLMGTGKTVVAKYVVKKLQDEAEGKGLKILSAYVSCIQYSNMYDVLVKAAQDVLGRDVGRGHSTGHYVDILTEKVEKSNGFILLLDEVDRLALRRTGDFSDLLYILSRSFQRTCAIMLTSKRKVADVLQREINGRSRDTFWWDPLDFRSYDALQLQDILRPRMEMAYRPGVYDQALINRICAICCDQGLGARGVIEIAARIGEMAESRAELVLSADDVGLAAGEIIRRLVHGPVVSLDSQCKAILTVLLRKEAMSNQEMENYYANHIAPNLKAGQSRQALYYHLGHLREADLLASYRGKRPRGRGSEGRLEVDPLQREIVKDALVSEDVEEE